MTKAVVQLFALPHPARVKIQNFASISQLNLYYTAEQMVLTPVVFPASIAAHSAKFSALFSKQQQFAPTDSLEGIYIC